MKYLITIAVSLMLLSADIGLSNPYNLAGKEVIVLNKPIEGGDGNKLGSKILNVKGKHLVLLIDSPGGSVLDMFKIMNTMEIYKRNGGYLTCIVTGGAYSAAFHILSRCQQRLALPYSTLLFHSASFSYFGRIDEKIAYRMYKGMKLLTGSVDSALAKQLGLSKRDYKEYNDASYMWAVGTFKRKFPRFIKIVSGISNIPEGTQIFK